jgi:hypothetical protein
MVDERARAVGGADIAADHLDLRKALLDPLHPVEHALRVAVRGVDHQHVDPRLHQRRDALVGVFSHADRGADAQLAVRILAGVRVLALLQDVLHGDQAEQMEIVVDHQHALEAVAVQQLHRFLAGRAFAHRDQLLLRRHDRLDRLVELGLEAQVAVGNDADHLPAVLHHREAGDLVLALQGDHVAHRHLGRNGHRVAQHAGLEALDLEHLGGLPLGIHVLVDDADAAFLRDGDRQARLGHRVHRRGHQRQVQVELPGEAGFERNFTRQDARVGGKKKDVVEGQRLLDHAHFSCSQSGIIRDTVIHLNRCAFLDYEKSPDQSCADDVRNRRGRAAVQMGR